MKSRSAVRNVRERRIRSPPSLGGTARDKKTENHHDRSKEKCPKARGIYFRKRHIRRADLERNDKITEGSKGDRHHPKEDHDGAMHRAERVVALRGKHSALGQRTNESPQPKPGVKMARDNRMFRPVQEILNQNGKVTDDRDRVARVCELPPHYHHQAE